MKPTTDRTAEPLDIAAMRKRLNLTQQQLADRLNTMAPGLHTIQQTVDKWERGERNPHPATAALIRLLAKGIDPSQLA